MLQRGALLPRAARDRVTHDNEKWVEPESSQRSPKHLATSSGTIKIRDIKERVAEFSADLI
jgi:hypothetical protein